MAFQVSFPTLLQAPSYGEAIDDTNIPPNALAGAVGTPGTGFWCHWGYPDCSQQGMACQETTQSHPVLDEYKM